jgi:pseudaminic acid synthase
MFNNSKTFIIAELSANHGGDINIAIETVKAAKRAGADAIKLQTYTADTITLDSDKESFKINQGTKWDGLFLYDLYKEASLPWEWHEEIFKVAKNEGLICFSSPFDKTAIDLLESLNNPIYKIASFEITDIPLIEYAASKGKPIIISTGIASDEDIKLAVDTCRSVGNNNITLLKCTSSYPAPIEDANLSMIKDLKERFNVESGLSDHTLGIVAPIVAVTLGATVIEKHFILNKEVGGPDGSFSLDENEFTQMVSAIRDAEKSFGIIDYTLTDKTKENRNFSRSIYITENVKKGDVLTEKNIRSIRPGFGLHPKHYYKILGKKINSNFEKGTPLSLDFIE